MSGLAAAACACGGEYYETYIKKIGSRNTALGYHVGAAALEPPNPPMDY